MYIHLAYRDAFATVDALVLLKLDAEEREPVKQAVKRTERADKSAEGTVNEYATNQNADSKAELPGEERAKHLEHTAVVRIDKQTDRTTHSSCRTDVLAEGRKGKVLGHINEGDDYTEYNKNKILEDRKRSCKFILLKLGCFDLM
jgi:hypothetical protein